MPWSSWHVPSVLVATVSPLLFIVTQYFVHLCCNADPLEVHKVVTHEQNHSELEQGGKHEHDATDLWGHEDKHQDDLIIITCKWSMNYHPHVQLCGV